ncbi:hypothetical protein ACWDFR_07230 [Streptomyces sp. 900105755]
MLPTQFHGDLPPAMEATYAGGTDAGPTDWTPHTGLHRVGTNPPRTDAEPPEPCASTR